MYVCAFPKTEEKKEEKGIIREKVEKMKEGD